MNIRRLIQLAGVPAAVALTVVSCGGGTGGQTGAGTVGVSSGPITGFGSVFVNGVEYSTSGAKIMINGSPATPSDLKVGMMVQVDGRIDGGGAKGTATKVEYDDQVRGVVDSVDAANNTLVVMGQKVAVDNMTVFHGTTDLAGVKAGNIVEVSGMVDSAGVIHATSIELKNTSFASGDTLNLRGKVSNLDTTAATFDIGAQPVSYATAVLNGLPTGLADGMTVLVKSTQGISPGGQLVASAVEGVSNNLRAPEGQELELEGIVTAFTSATDFSVNGQPVTTTPSTRFVHGSASSLAPNVRIEVEGSTDASGVLVADKVNVQIHPEIEVSAGVQAVDPAGGTLTLLGRKFTVDANTVYRDEGSVHARFFRIKDIAVGDRLDVRAYQNAGALVATRVERRNAPPDGTVELKARVSTVNSPDLQMLGMTVATDTSTSFRIGDTSVTSTDFFAGVTGGDVLDVRGSLTGDGSIQAVSIAQDH